MARKNDTAAPAAATTAEVSDAVTDTSATAESTTAQPETIAAPAPEVAAPESEPVVAATAEVTGLFAELQDAMKGAIASGDHAAHGAFAALETCFVDLRARVASIEGGASDDVKAMITKIKAIL